MLRELTIGELDAVVGGMNNNGQGQFLQDQPKYGGPDRDNGRGFAAMALYGGIAVAIIASL